MIINKRKNSKSAQKIFDEVLGHVAFGEMIKSLRMGQEITQVELANKLKISKQEVCDIERGRKTVSVERAVKFAKILKESPEVFVTYILEDEIYKAGLKLKVTAA